MNTEFVTPELEEAAQLIEDGAGKAADKLLRSRLETPPEGNDRWRWPRFLRKYCNDTENKHSALPLGIGVETLRKSGVDVIVMPTKNSNAHTHLKAVIEAAKSVFIDIDELERVAKDPSAAAAQAWHSLVIVSKKDSLLFADAAPPYSIGTAGCVNIHWIVGQDENDTNISSYTSGWITNALVEVISHGAERPVIEGTHLTVRMSIQVAADGRIIDARPMIADDGYGIQFGTCICS